MFVSCLDMIEHNLWYSQTNFPAFYHIAWKSLIQTASDFNLKSEKKAQQSAKSVIHKCIVHYVNAQHECMFILRQLHNNNATVMKIYFPPKHITLCISGHM